MKKVKYLLALAALALAVTSQAQNTTVTYSPGFTFVNTNATSNVVISASTILTNSNHEELYLQTSFNSDTADTVNGSTVKFYWGTSPYRTNFDIGNIATLRSWTVVPTNGTSTTRYSTNLYVGSARYFAIVAVANSCTNGSITNLTFKAQWKDHRSGL